jgi:hypothetical protein
MRRRHLGRMSAFLSLVSADADRYIKHLSIVSVLNVPPLPIGAAIYLFGSKGPDRVRCSVLLGVGVELDGILRGISQSAMTISSNYSPRAPTR